MEGPAQVNIVNRFTRMFQFCLWESMENSAVLLVVDDQLCWQAQLLRRHELVIRPVQVAEFHSCGMQEKRPGYANSQAALVYVSGRSSMESPPS